MKKQNLILAVIFGGLLMITSCSNCSRSGKRNRLTKMTEVELVYKIADIGNLANMTDGGFIVDRNLTKDSFVEVKIPYCYLKSNVGSLSRETRHVVTRMEEQFGEVKDINNIGGMTLDQAGLRPSPKTEEDMKEVFLSVRVNPRWGKNESGIDYVFGNHLSEPLCGYNESSTIRKKLLVSLCSDLENLNIK